MSKTAEWKTYRFEEFVEHVRESVEPTPEDSARYIGLEHLDSGSLHVHRWGTGIILKGKKLRIKKGDILYAKRNAYLRRVAIAPFDGIFSAHGMVLRPKTEVVLPEFLPHFLQSEMFFERALAISVGSLSPTINWKTLARQEFPLPTIDKQRRIAEVLWGTDEAVEKQLLLQHNLEELRFAIGNAVWGKEKKPRKIGLESGLNQWVNITLGQSCIKIQDGTHFSPKSKEGDFMYITSKNIKDGFLDLDDIGWITEDEHENIYRRCDVKHGDLLLTKDGVNTGNVAINLIDEPFSLLSSVALLRTNLNLLDTEYLFHYFRSPQGKGYVTSFMKGTAITRLTLVVIRNMRLLLPPIEDQRRLAKKLNAIRDSYLESQNDYEKLQLVKKNLVIEMIG